MFEDVVEEIDSSKNLEELEKIRLSYLGKNGKITLKLKELGKLDIEQRKEKGSQLNSLKVRIENSINTKKNQLNKQVIDEKIKKDSIDITLPARSTTKGSIHPFTHIKDFTCSYFSRLGFDIIQGPEIEEEYYNFDALNIPQHHPARQSQDTFYLKGKLLRTHTTSLQVRFMENNPPPIRMISIGRVYRSDAIDATHTPMFHQFEGLVIEESINMSHLKGCLLDFCRSFFQDKSLQIRFRPSFFPYTEPSAEIDIGRKGKWLEWGGCGMVHPKILKNCKIDPEKFQGFAFGMGIERLSMVKYGISDIRNFFNNDLRFLKQFC